MSEVANETSTFSLQASRTFAEKYSNITNEKQYSQSFWTDLFTKVIGVPDLLAAGIEFEYPVISSEGKTNWIDVFWSGVLLIEQKSTGKNLDLAETQARSYLVGLPPEHRPPAIIVSDFSKFRIIDVLMNEQIEFSLSELPDNLHRLESLLGKQIASATRQEATADIHAVELMGNLFNAFEKAGYEGHALSVFLVRVLFLNFGDDTRMWKRFGNGLFGDFIANSAKDGNGLGAQIQELFQVLNTPVENRAKTISPNLANFPYINGGVFEENLPIFSFNADMRKALVETTQYDWSKISPAIFGAMFQTVKSKEDRRSLGEHYTSEANILKVIRPLFLDDYLEKLSKSWESIPNLKKLRKELSENNYLDPACGSGNFLVVAYRRLREIELKIVARLNELEGKEGHNQLEGTWGLSVHLNQFHGIEINEWSSQIATVAMFIADHQANLAMEEITGFAPERFPLKESAKIVHANALRTNWQELCPMSPTTYIMGNPPFYGARWQSKEQKEDTAHVWENMKSFGELDFVTNWFKVSAEHVNKSGCKVSFVATNSISQGEQPSLIWSKLYGLNVEIDFAHRSFVWNNESKGNAAVHCVIIGFSKQKSGKKKILWTYKRSKGEASVAEVSNINAYLLDAPNVLVTSRSKPLQIDTPKNENGSMPNDGGFLSNISAEEAQSIREQDPIAAKYLKRLVGARELINAEERWCLWLVGADPSDIRNSKVLQTRVQAVRELRESSNRAATKKLAERPSEFAEIRQPSGEYIAIPRISSEEREYVPLAILNDDYVLNDKCSSISGGSKEYFGVLQSRVFNVWNKAISGRTRNDTLISNTITYNNFPFPDLAGEHGDAISKAAEQVLTARSEFTNNSLADLYDKNAMPKSLRSAQMQLDNVVIKSYGLNKESTDEQILMELFDRYSKLSDTNPLVSRTT